TSTATTVPPSRPMISAVARPIPRPAAVISATRPVNLMAAPPFLAPPRPGAPPPRDGLRPALPSLAAPRPAGPQPRDGLQPGTAVSSRPSNPRAGDLPCQFAPARLPAMKYEMISADWHLTHV